MENLSMSIRSSTAHSSVSPTFRELTDSECRTLLGRHNVGRIAFSFHDRVDIQPIHYAANGDWVYGRTSRGGKYLALAHNPWCAFEVDEVRGLFDWDSVVVKGRLELLDPELGSEDAYEKGLKLMRALVPGTFSAVDPVPDRLILFRIHMSELSGRSARSASHRSP
jgi:nitroimidazol reductase NimA-like FMN-containing flavoprotein (pyridoxamine 5'-phosphate oxidase superfamily)